MIRNFEAHTASPMLHRFDSIRPRRRPSQMIKTRRAPRISLIPSHEVDSFVGSRFLHCICNVLEPLCARFPAASLTRPRLIYFQAPRADGIQWGPCSGVNNTQVTCGFYEVPLDYQDSSKGKARLAVAKYAATASEKLGTLFTNPGELSLTQCHSDPNDRVRS